MEAGLSVRQLEELLRRKIVILELDKSTIEGFEVAIEFLFRL